MRTVIFKTGSQLFPSAPGVWHSWSPGSLCRSRRHPTSAICLTWVLLQLQINAFRRKLKCQEKRDNLL